MKKIETDVAVIGAGSAGLAAYRAVRAQGKRAVIIESWEYGTTCARVGCMPSKLLIAAAEAAHAVDTAPAFGVDTGIVDVDGRAVMERVRRERDRFVGFVVESTEAIDPADRLHGYARFEDANTLRVGEGVRVRADSVVIATGSSPMLLPIFQDLGDRVIVNDDIFSWQDLPRSVAVFGPGVIGLELGQALHRLGVRVVMFGKGGLVGPVTDPKLRDYAAAAFAQEFPLDADADVDFIRREGEQVVIRYRGADDEWRIGRFDYVLAATGRVPNVSDLGLENTGLALDARGVPLFDRETLQAGDSAIFVAGDANNDRPLLHEASDEGRIAGANAARFPFVKRGVRTSPLAVVFSDPQMATIGSRYADLRPGCFVIGEVSFENQGRSRVMLQNKGLLRVYADPCSGRLLGAEMIGPRAEHMAHLLAWAHQQGLSIDDMLGMPFYHPVVEEGLRTALRDAAAKLREGPSLVDPCNDCRTAA
ncbi:dihydrolipoyl dehydrogenase [Alkalilimnicola ehrlichii]|uniref:Dihydrolipoyl dehydrogenase n=1 Tax=Alkalilimnicola ehrlichii TaxID=351052 RepID=A0A3E0WJ75_9GAMM|nr:dihydrolipoyl dehydrogenase [Alkalilimnicola ehrlichii]RFA24492.1 dihydrolipoyl dehydrogenase [Alkalilimnicola ehrlichii]RFA32157.1 dihydrolipoyl dehydrogenase [Alkalilimnicola ehrlichii]